MRRRYLIFYFLVAYMLSVFFWWWIMMFRKDNDLYREKIQLLYHRYQQENSGMLLEEYDKLMEERRLQQWMIVGEGATFLILMIFGIYRLRKAVVEEVGLAGRQKNFLLSITHELKSPLASARLNLQTLNRRTLSEEQQKLLLQNTEQDIIRLNELVEKILLASKMDHKNMHINKEEVNYSELAETCSDELLQRNMQVKLDVAIEPNIWVNGDDVLLKSLIMNLLENAVKYAPKGTTTGLHLNKVQDMAVLDIMDEGKPIPAEEREKIFERFYRMGNEDTRTSTGVGLGLFIVQQVAQMHHGSVKIKDQPGGGKIFSVEIPYIGAI